MGDEELLATAFEAERARLRSVAYRMLGSADEADDAVQEAWLRLQRTDGIDNLGGWLTTVVSRVCLDMLRSRSSRREDGYADVEATVVARRGRDIPSSRPSSPTRWAARCSSCSRPSRRPSDSPSCCTTCSPCPSTRSRSVIGRSPAATRQLASRGRRRVQQPDAVTGAGDREVVDAFLDRLT